MSILIATDSYKGCLTSLEAGKAMERGVHDALPHALTTVLPISDGGEGMLLAFAEGCGGQSVHLKAHDALMHPIETAFVWDENQHTAYIELAATAGLTLLKPEERHPMRTTTFGVGETIRAALAMGARTIVVGLGGSATNDGGTGMAEALGFRFRDQWGKVLHGRGENLKNIETIDDFLVPEALKKARFIAACDVKAPLCGPQGAAKVFATQKGASAEEVERLDEGLLHFGTLLSRYSGSKVTQQEGAGAAGGTGAALLALLGAHMESGIRLLLKTTRYVRAFSLCDAILTGEGCMDRQTSMGKAAWGLLQEGRRLGKPVYAIAGSIGRDTLPEKLGFTAALTATPAGMPLAEALQPTIAKQNIQNAARRLFMSEKNFNTCK